MNETYMKKIEKAAQAALKAKYEKMIENDSEVLTNFVWGAIEQVVFKAIGIRRNHWDRWEILNVFSGGAPLQAKIKKAADKTLKELLPKLKVELTEKDISQIQKEYKEQYKRYLFNIAENYAEAAAKRDSKAFFESIKLED